MNTLLEKLTACGPAMEWANAQVDYSIAWENCERGDWMLWAAKKANIDLRILTKAKVECAKLVEHLMVDDRSISALRVAEEYAAGNATQEQLDAAADDAAAAADAAYAAYAAAAAAYAAAAADAGAAARAAYDAALRDKVSK